MRDNDAYTQIAELPPQVQHTASTALNTKPFALSTPPPPRKQKLSPPIP